jgi:hypothetical protein
MFHRAGWDQRMAGVARPRGCGAGGWWGGSGAVVLEGWWGRVGVLLLLGDAGGVEGGDVAQGAGGALDQGQGEQGAGAFAEAQAQVD